jgi:hypothetical protein
LSKIGLHESTSIFSTSQISSFGISVETQNSDSFMSVGNLGLSGVRVVKSFCLCSLFSLCLSSNSALPVSQGVFIGITSSVILGKFIGLVCLNISLLFQVTGSTSQVKRVHQETSSNCFQIFSSSMVSLFFAI